MPLAPAALAGLIALIDKGTISSSIAKDVFAKMYDSGRSAEEIVARRRAGAEFGDEGALLAIVRDVIGKHADAVAQYRAGKQQTFGFLVGQVMKGSGGKANPKLASRSAQARAWSTRAECRILGLANSAILIASSE